MSKSYARQLINYSKLCNSLFTTEIEFKSIYIMREDIVLQILFKETISFLLVVFDCKNVVGLWAVYTSFSPIFYNNIFITTLAEIVTFLPYSFS